jgi:hypothetical protein
LKGRKEGRKGDILVFGSCIEIARGKYEDVKGDRQVF